MQDNPTAQLEILEAVPAAAAATSAINGEIIDMANFESVAFCVSFGTGAAGNTVKVQQGAVSNMSDAADLEGSLATSAANDLVVVEVIRPQERYVRCVLARGTSSTAGGVAVVTGGRVKKPANASATVVSLVSPAEGTA